MDSLPTTHGETILGKSTQVVLRTYITAAALVVLLHTLAMLVHGAAHMRLNIELSAWANIYVLCIVGIGPITGFFFLKSSRQRTGATILFTTMVGALVFGVWKHFIAHGPDHVMHLQASGWRLPFQATAVLLAASELVGAIVPFRLLYVLAQTTKARIRARND